MSKNTIKSYYNREANKINEDYLVSKTINHSGIKGEKRERIIADFLTRQLSSHFHVNKNIELFNHLGKTSKELDIVVTNNTNFNFSNMKLGKMPVEYAAAVITIKSNLDKTNLIDCLENLASVPRFSNDVIQTRGLLDDKEATIGFITKFPVNVIYAYEGINHKKIVEHLNEYYITNKLTPYNRRAHIVIVNKTTLISIGKEGGYDDSSEAVEENDNFGYAYAMMIHRITEYIDWIPYLRISLVKHIYSSFFDNPDFFK